jgi:hypothetical protein
MEQISCQCNVLNTFGGHFYLTHLQDSPELSRNNSYPKVYFFLQLLGYPALGAWLTCLVAGQERAGSDNNN